jgi:hypothetical protein
MFFIGLRTTADLSLATPPDCCCNCGARRDLELVETPLQRTRYFLLAGTELTLNETFPYCKACRRSAKRVRLGWMSKTLVALIVAAALFMGIAIGEPALPSVVRDHLFMASLAIAIVLTAMYFYWCERGGKRRSYYQPVSLIDADVSGEAVRSIRLRFLNRDYARIFSNANPELVAAGAVIVESG